MQNSAIELQSLRVSSDKYMTPSLFNGFLLQPGDIIFQDLGCGPLCDAIEGVTSGYHDSSVSHVGMFVSGELGGVVAEAIYPVVRNEPLRRFMQRSRDEQQRPRSFVGRLKPDYRNLIPDAIHYSQRLLGLLYDRAFGDGEDSYYCSELIVDCFSHANHGAVVFEEHPMHFRDPRTGDILQYWRDYFRLLGTEVPEGHVGSNPGRMSLSSKLEIVHQFGSLAGWPKP